MLTTANYHQKMALQLITVVIAFIAVLSLTTATAMELADQSSHLTNSCSCSSSKSIGRFCGFRSASDNLGKKYLKDDCVPQDVYLCEGVRDAPARVLINCGGCVIRCR
jgi:hypothetical protein